MAGALSRRQQARNEKTLHDLVQSVPGNNVCADCQARNPCVFPFPWFRVPSMRSLHKHLIF